ncbi:rhodanese-like domain-containing protein [Nocardioides mesophilus]|uniref:Rhodanese-like domain-containing protein n=1 Tax=Nocardioides mesophilus TaxID=433659 RepID=A0A7G9RDL7_9ACTN|nr:rhodanese-like domain-containing protein [Nocardioides mesophilus]QNN53692.1 rhodanese-like domain-containing protein [Nocardioides mesophilus]
MSADDGSAISRLLAENRSSLRRVRPEELETARAAGALVVDIRPLEQRQRDGELPGAVVVDRNVLEWRLDPTSPHRLAIADDPERRVVLVCNEGYSSSLAARTLQLLGLVNATDLCGGFVAWRSTVGGCAAPPHQRGGRTGARSGVGSGRGRS